jgi:hypothetical protein
MPSSHGAPIAPGHSHRPTSGTPQGIFTRLLRLAVAAATGVATRAAASSGRIAAFVPPRPRGRHDLPRKCPRVRDHDQLPIRGPHGEAIGVMLFEDAKDVGDLLAVIWAGPAPADNDPLTDVGPGEPDREPVAHAGHLFRGLAARAAASLATTPLPAGDVAGDAVGVIRQRAGLRGAAGRAEPTGQPGVLRGEPGPLLGNVIVAEDRLHRADPLAVGAVGAVTGADVEHPPAFVNTIDGHSSMRALSLTSMYGSTITYVMGRLRLLGDLCPPGLARAFPGDREAG